MAVNCFRLPGFAVFTNLFDFSDFPDSRPKNLLPFAFYLSPILPILVVLTFALPIMPKYCLTLDLKDDIALIAEYERYHEDIWPEIRESITSAGITGLEIYRFDTRLFMIMEVDDTFSFERKAEMDAANPKVQEWEDLMWNYQQPLKKAMKGEKWVLMNKIFEL